MCLLALVGFAPARAEDAPAPAAPAAPAAKPDAGTPKPVEKDRKAGAPAKPEPQAKAAGEQKPGAGGAKAGETAKPDAAKPGAGAPAQPGEEKPAGEPAKPGGAKPEGEEPAKPGRQPGPPLAVTGVASLEVLPRDYDETLDFYVGVLGFREGDTSGGEGERQCVLVGQPGPVRIKVRELAGKVVRPKRSAWLGVHPALLSELTAEAAGMKEPRGALVEDIVPQGPAAICGILKGDIILAVEGKETPSPEALIATVRGFAPGKKVLVTVWRERKRRDIPVDLPPSPFPEQLAPVILHLQVNDLDGYYKELLKRTLKVYAEPRDMPGGGRVLEVVDPNDVLVVLEQPAP